MNKNDSIKMYTFLNHFELLSNLSWRNYQYEKCSKMSRHLFSDANERISRDSYFSSKPNSFLYCMSMHKNNSMKKRMSSSNHHLTIQRKFLSILSIVCSCCISQRASGKLSFKACRRNTYLWRQRNETLFCTGPAKYLLLCLKKNYRIFSQISCFFFFFFVKVQSFRLIMENNFIQMAASASHLVAYTIVSIFKHIIDCVQLLYFTNGFANIIL